MELPRGISTVSDPQPKKIVCPVVEQFKQRSNLNLPKYDPNITLEELKTHWILQALKYANGNKTHAAKLLDIGKETLYRRLREKK